MKVKYYHNCGALLWSGKEEELPEPTQYGVEICHYCGKTIYASEVEEIFEEYDKPRKEEVKDHE